MTDTQITRTDDMTGTIREVLRLHGRLTKEVDSLDDDENLYALGLTSHATVTVVMGLEDALDIEIPDELLVKKTFTSVATLRSALRDAL